MQRTSEAGAPFSEAGLTPTSASDVAMSCGASAGAGGGVVSAGGRSGLATGAPGIEGESVDDPGSRDLRPVGPGCCGHRCCEASTDSPLRRSSVWRSG